jgi:hypothetical protein
LSKPSNSSIAKYLIKMEIRKIGVSMRAGEFLSQSLFNLRKMPGPSFMESVSTMKPITSLPTFNWLLLPSLLLLRSPCGWKYPKLALPLTTRMGSNPILTPRSARSYV